MRKSDKLALKEFEKRAKKSGKNLEPQKATSKEIDPSFAPKTETPKADVLFKILGIGTYYGEPRLPHMKMTFGYDDLGTYYGEPRLPHMKMTFGYDDLVVTNDDFNYPPPPMFSIEQTLYNFKEALAKNPDAHHSLIPIPISISIDTETKTHMSKDIYSSYYFDGPAFGRMAEPAKLAEPDTRTPEQLQAALRDKENLLKVRDRELQNATAKLREQDKYLKGIADAGHVLATVTDIRGDRMTISGGQTLDVKLLAGAKIGDVVACHAETYQALHVIPVTPSGTMATIRAILPTGQVEVEDAGGLSAGRVLRAAVPVQEGDRVVVDMTNTVVIQNLGKPKSQLAWEKPTNTTWDDIGGHEDAKRALRDAIETPFLHPEIYARFGKKPTKGVLLYGPPGTGKTLLAKAAATALARVHGHETAQGFIYVKGPALLSKWVGESESSVRQIFNAAREHQKAHGYPALVFIDEAEAILGKRGDGARFMTQTMVPQFLAEMDGLEESGCMVLLATNRPSDLDPAVTREGRIDRKVRIGRPNQEDTVRITEIHLKGRPCADGLAVTLGSMMHETPIGLIAGPGGGTAPVYLSAFSSGAMIAGIVEEATTSALNRDLANGTEGVIGEADIREGVDRIMNGLAALDHTDVLRELIASHPEICQGNPDVKPSLELGPNATEKLSN